MAQGLFQKKKIHPLLSFQPFPMLRAKACELRVMTRAQRNLLNLGIETMTSTAIIPFQVATMAPKLCTELKVRASVLVGSEPARLFYSQ